jgi:hypothetical protein
MNNTHLISVRRFGLLPFSLTATRKQLNSERGALELA